VVWLLSRRVVEWTEAIRMRWRRRVVAAEDRIAQALALATAADFAIFELVASTSRGRVSGAGGQGSQKGAFTRLDHLSLTFGDDDPAAASAFVCIDSLDRRTWLQPSEELEEEFELWLLVMSGRRERFTGPFTPSGFPPVSNVALVVDGAHAVFRIRQLDACWCGWADIRGTRVVVRARGIKPSEVELRPVADLARYEAGS
jgi:hypothetical protein